MIGPVTFATVPTFGTAAAKTQPPAPDPYDDGYLPAEQWPSQHANWFLAGLTGNGNLEQAAINSLIAELDGLVTGTGGVVNPGDPTQILVGAQQASLQTVSTNISTTPAALTMNEFLTVTAAGVTLQDFSAGAARAGIQVAVYVSGAGVCTVKLGAALSIVVPQGNTLRFFWNGVAWVPLSSVGSTNSAVGLSALFAITTGTDNTAFGYKALAANTTGSGNTAIGSSALLANTTGKENTAVGYQALAANTFGVDNTAIGYKALAANTTGTYETAVGSSALAANTAGTYNTAVGYFALTVNTTGTGNTAVGYSSLSGSTTGINNTAVGASSGYNISTGSGNVSIGASAAASAAGVNNEVSIYSGTQYARFQSSASAWSWVSDERDKTDIADSEIGLDFLLTVPVKKYRWNNRVLYKNAGKKKIDGSLAEKRFTHGFTAQSIDAAESKLGAPIGLVIKNDPDQWSVADTKLIPIMVNSIKELAGRVRALEGKKGKAA